MKHAVPDKLRQELINTLQVLVDHVDEYKEIKLKHDGPYIRYARITLSRAKGQALLGDQPDCN